MLRILKRLKKRINFCGVVSYTMMGLVFTRRFLSFMSFLKFSCTTLWVQNVSIPPDQIVWIPQDQTVLIFFLSDLYIRNIETVLHRKAWYSSTPLLILSIFLVWLLGPTSCTILPTFSPLITSIFFSKYENIAPLLLYSSKMVT